MVEIQIEYRGELRTGSVHGPSGTELVTDAPTDNQGRGESYSPTDLVATALGTCMATIMAMAARERGIELAGTRVRVEKHMAAEPVRRIARLEVTIEVPHDLDEEARATLEEAARGCPVTASMGAEVEIPVTFRWGS